MDAFWFSCILLFPNLKIIITSKHPSQYANLNFVLLFAPSVVILQAFTLLNSYTRCSVSNKIAQMCCKCYVKQKVSFKGKEWGILSKGRKGLVLHQCNDKAKTNISQHRNHSWLEDDIFSEYYVTAYCRKMFHSILKIQIFNKALYKNQRYLDCRNVKSQKRILSFAKYL